MRFNMMQQDVLYLKLEKNVKIELTDVYLKDIGKLYSKNDNIVISNEVRNLIHERTIVPSSFHHPTCSF